MLALAGQPVPSVSAHGGLLAAAFRARSSAEAITLAPRNVRDDPQRLCEDCCAGGGAQALDQARLPAPRATRQRARASHPSAHRTRPVIGAAGAAGTRSLPPSTRAKACCTRRAVNPADVARPTQICFAISDYGE